MGQKSNINTLRLLNETTLSNNNIKLNFLEIVVIKYLKFLLKLKGIQISKTTFGLIDNKVFIYIHVFFGTQKIIRYKKYKRISSLKIKLKTIKLLNLIFKFLRTSILEVKIININKQIDKALTRQAFSIYKKYLNNLFDKKFYMCLDMTKITVLYLLNKIDDSIFLDHTGKIFSTIHKKNHLRFFKLLSSVFNFLITNENNILGLKLLVSGKLLGKSIASQQQVTLGSMPVQTLNKNINFKKTHVYTVYGVFGFKLWTYRKNII